MDKDFVLHICYILVYVKALLIKTFNLIVYKFMNPMKQSFILNNYCHNININVNYCLNTIL